MSEIFSKINFRNKKIVFFLILVLLVSKTSLLNAASNDFNYKYITYIQRYNAIAVNHMKQYKIPASITLSQGLLESGAGSSDLAIKSNNHFGIKCSPTWLGDRVIAKDDTPYDCFRKYKSVEESYEDHAQFLAYRDRYSSLFLLDITDYRGWAIGLQKAGYASDKAYASKLIRLIEEYKLYLYDRQDVILVPDSKEEVIENTETSKHVVYKTHGLVYIVARKNDTFESIAHEFGFKVSDLYAYNDAVQSYPLQEGDLVYFQVKKKKADKPYFEHKVKVGESMHSISQLYGIRLDKLYALNKKHIGYVLEEGDILKLR